MPEEMQPYLRATKLLDYENRELMTKREHLLGHGVQTPREKVRALYGMVSNLPLGYSRNDDIAASEVLRDGFGQCNTKVTLLTALARGAGIPTRIHGYAIDKEAQRKRAPDWLVRCMPRTTVFFWPEFFIAGKWTPLQKIVFLSARAWDSCPFDGAKYQLAPLQKEWNAQDLGYWATPDDFFRKHMPTANGWRKIGWYALGRGVMNRRLRKSND